MKSSLAAKPSMNELGREALGETDAELALRALKRRPGCQALALVAPPELGGLLERGRAEAELVLRQQLLRLGQ